MKTQVIRVRYFDSVSRLMHISTGNCIDLTIANILEETDEYVVVDFGLAMELPEGYIAKIYPRSSTFKNYGLILSNSVGIIDNSYCGDTDKWKAIFYKARKNDNLLVEQGIRIAQFEIVPAMNATVLQKLKYLFTSRFRFKEVAFLGNKSRGGYGSTGK